MKKLFAILLVLCMMAGLSSVAYAACDHDWSEWMVDYTQKGYTLNEWEDCYFINTYLWRYCYICDEIDETLYIDYYPHHWAEGVTSYGYECIYCTECGVIGVIHIR